LFRLQNAKKREALDAAQAKKKNANFSAVIPDRDWTEEEKQVREREREIQDLQHDFIAQKLQHTTCHPPALHCTTPLHRL
jgi:hypothetical protein